MRLHHVPGGHAALQDAHDVESLGGVEEAKEGHRLPSLPSKLRNPSELLGGAVVEHFVQAVPQGLREGTFQSREDGAKEARDPHEPLAIKDA